MTPNAWKRLALLLGSGIISLLPVVIAGRQRSAEQQDDTAPAVYGEFADRQQYSELSQINTSNVKNLRVAWTYDLGETGKSFQATPIVVGNMMYFPTPDSKVVALDAMTGKQIWKYDPVLKYTRVSRGVAYWPGGPNTPPRILFGTADGRLIALDPKTGSLISDFGDNGQVNVKEMALKGFLESAFWYTSPPSILQDRVIVAPALQEGPSRGATGGGDPRAFDVLTGKQEWQFHSMPRAGEDGVETWGGGANGTVDRSGPSAWVPIAVDRKRNLVFVTTGNAPGGSPFGKNLYTNTVLALDGNTGKLLWHFQMVHHDIWDFDSVDSAVIEVRRNGSTVPAVAALNKSGSLFILNELTGEPLFGVEERAVPQNDEGAQKAYPTQPFPTAPPPLTLNGMTEARLANLNPESAKYCKDLWDASRHDGPFTPSGSQPSVNFPSSIGGPNWDSISFNPKLGLMFVSTSEMGAPRRPRGQIENEASPSRQPPRRGGIRFVDPNGYPCQAPPWGLLTAIDPGTGKIVWKVTLGNYEKIEEGKPAAPALTSLPEAPGKQVIQKTCSTQCHDLGPVLQARKSRAAWTDTVNGMTPQISAAQKQEIVGYLAKFLAPTAKRAAGPAKAKSPQTGTSASAPERQPTGTPNLGGTMTTAGNLVFVGATLDNKFRAFDASTGRELWSYQLDGTAQATAMTFLGTDGKQYIAIASGGPGLLGGVHNTASDSPDKIVVFSLSK